MLRNRIESRIISYLFLHYLYHSFKKYMYVQLQKAFEPIVDVWLLKCCARTLLQWDTYFRNTYIHIICKRCCPFLNSYSFFLDLLKQVLWIRYISASILTNYINHKCVELAPCFHKKVRQLSHKCEHSK